VRHRTVTRNIGHRTRNIGRYISLIFEWIKNKSDFEVCICEAESQKEQRDDHRDYERVGQAVGDRAGVNTKMLFKVDHLWLL
jgi:hypothetical protein